MTQPLRAIIQALPTPMLSVIYATGHVPFVLMLEFPPNFTAEDKGRAYEGLRALYEEVASRKSGE